MHVQNTTALVTGANRGIGRTLVDALLDAGAAKVYATARRLDSLNDVHPGDDRVARLALDLADETSIQAAAGDAKDARLIINNAGVLHGGSFLEAPDDEIRADMETNYFGALRVARAFAPNLIAHGGGAFANLNSVVSLASMPSIGGYSASKAAAHSLTLALRGELAPRNIEVIGIYPGPIETDMTKDFDFETFSVAATAKNIVAGINAGEQSVFPDPFAENTRDTWRAGPETLQNQFAGIEH
ncbi:MAG: SDR family oxidoreductase [Planctomycetota bacterium]